MILITYLLSSCVSRFFSVIPNNKKDHIIKNSPKDICIYVFDLFWYSNNIFFDILILCSKNKVNKTIIANRQKKIEY